MQLGPVALPFLSFRIVLMSSWFVINLSGSLTALPDFKSLDSSDCTLFAKYGSEQSSCGEANWRFKVFIKVFIIYLQLLFGVVPIAEPV